MGNTPSIQFKMSMHVGESSMYLRSFEHRDAHAPGPGTSFIYFHCIVSLTVADEDGFQKRFNNEGVN